MVTLVLHLQGYQAGQDQIEPEKLFTCEPENTGKVKPRAMSAMPVDMLGYQ
jgi:hypothetical protein